MSTLASWKFCTAYLGNLDSISSTPLSDPIPETQFPIFYPSCDKALSLGTFCKYDSCANQMLPFPAFRRPVLQTQEAYKTTKQIVSLAAGAWAQSQTHS